MALAHTHDLMDHDGIFTIEPASREIITSNTKIVLMQYDHNSEVFTFQIPRIVEGHDMSLCNKIEIHYTNINKKTKEQSKDVYTVTDQKVEGDNLVFTWLLSGNATKHAGTLNFIIRFVCLEEDNTYSYIWHTGVFKNITVSDGINNAEAIVEDYSDVLENWKNETINYIKDQVYTKSQIDTALEELQPVQPDYNQNDSAAKDFIKNRTHYEDIAYTATHDFGSLEFTQDSDYYSCVVGDMFPFVAGTKYCVYFDDQYYDCVADSMGCFGNLGLNGGEDTGEPVLINIGGGCIKSKVGGTHTVSYGLMSKTIHKLDPKFLDDTHINELIDAKLGGIENGTY